MSAIPVSESVVETLYLYNKDDFFYMLDQEYPEFSDACDKFKYLSQYGNFDTTRFMCAFNVNGELIGIVKLGLNPYQDRLTYWINYCSVREDYRNMGVASALLDQTFDLTVREGFILELSRYSKMGKQYLPNLIERLIVKYPDVELIRPPEHDDLI